jgi:UDPglucose 6-dehydrogenase
MQKLAYDPVIKALVDQILGLSIVDSALEACDGADALAVMTPWPEFSAIDPGLIRKQMRGNVLIDPFAVLNRRACHAAGFSYHKLGS